MTTVDRKYAKESFGTLTITTDDPDYSVIIKIALRDLLQKYQDNAQHLDQHPVPEEPNLADWYADQILKIKALLQHL
jgi:hypothetical protein